MIRNVIVLGGGSAGFLAAITLKKKLPDLTVTVVRSKEIGVIGVGEGTTLGVPKHLHGYLDLDQADFYRKAQPSWKLGARFLWGPRPTFDYTFSLQVDWKWDRLPKANGYYCDDDFTYADVPSAMMTHKKAFLRQPNGEPLIKRYFGYHLENQRFVAYLEETAAEVGVVTIDDILKGVDQDDNGITALHFASGATMSADLYVDASGFRSLLLGEALKVPYVSFRTTLFCDRAVVCPWKRTHETINPYTTIESMSSGWCWQIDHPDMIARGYVYSSAFQSDEDADKELRALVPKGLETRVVKFPSGRYANSWVKNVIAMGNAAGFVEPLEATSLAVICDESRLLADCLLDSDRDPAPSMVDHYNGVNLRAWNCIRDFLGIHYKFNTRYDTPFWKACRADVELGPIQHLVDYYKENGPSSFALTSLIHADDFFGMEGYFALLVGQKVPYRRRHTPTPDELRIWQGIRADHRVKALTALSVREALDAIASPNWRWVPGFYRQPMPALTPISQLTSFVGAV